MYQVNPSISAEDNLIAMINSGSSSVFTGTEFTVSAPEEYTPSGGEVSNTVIHLTANEGSGYMGSQSPRYLRLTVGATRPGAFTNWIVDNAKTRAELITDILTNHQILASEVDFTGLEAGMPAGGDYGVLTCTAKARSYFYIGSFEFNVENTDVNVPDPGGPGADQNFRSMFGGEGLAGSPDGVDGNYFGLSLDIAMIVQGAPTTAKQSLLDRMNEFYEISPPLTEGEITFGNTEELEGGEQDYGGLYTAGNGYYQIPMTVTRSDFEGTGFVVLPSVPLDVYLNVVRMNNRDIEQTAMGTKADVVNAIRVGYKIPTDFGITLDVGPETIATNGTEQYSGYVTPPPTGGLFIREPFAIPLFNATNLP